LPSSAKRTVPSAALPSMSSMKQRYSRSHGVDGSHQYASAAFDGQADSIQCSKRRFDTGA